MDPSQSAPDNQHHEGNAVPLGPKDWPTAALLEVAKNSSQSPLPNDQSNEGGVVPLMPRAPMDPSQSAPDNQHHEGNDIPLGPKDWPTAALLKVPMDSSQSPPPNDQRREGDVVPLMPKVPIDSPPSPPRNDQRHEAHVVVPIVPKDRKEARSSGAAHDPIVGRESISRIRNELATLGIEVAVSTVAKYMPRRRKPPSPTWRAFLENHLKELVALDFFVVPTATFRVLFGLVVLALHRRRVVHLNVTSNPTAEWTARQLIQAFPEETTPRFLVRDRDAIYGERFRQAIEALGIEEVVTAARSPWQNPYAERVIGSLRRDCLD